MPPAIGGDKGGKKPLETGPRVSASPAAGGGLNILGGELIRSRWPAKKGIASSLSLPILSLREELGRKKGSIRNAPSPRREEPGISGKKRKIRPAVPGDEGDTVPHHPQEHHHGIEKVIYEA